MLRVRRFPRTRILGHSAAVPAAVESEFYLYIETTQVLLTDSMVEVSVARYVYEFALCVYRGVG